jgi:integrase
LLKSVTQERAKRILVVLRAIIREAQRRGLVAQNIARDIKIEASNRDKGKVGIGIDVPTEDEVLALIAHAGQLLRPLLVTAIHTGMRIGEMRALTWEDVDFDRDVIIVNKSGRIHPIAAASR